MWRTELGERILTDGEAALFRAGLASFIVHLNRPEDVDSLMDIGVSAFDRLTFPEKMAMLEIVARGLLDADVPCPQLSAVSEGALGAVYYHIMAQVELEIDENRRAFRPLIREACEAMGITEDLPKPNSKRVDAWLDCVEMLMDLIFFDRDWEQENVPLDASPEIAGEFKEYFGIDDDYYSAVAPDPSPQQLERIRSSLQQMTHRPPPEPHE